MDMKEVEEILKNHDKELDSMTEEEKIDFYKKFGMKINPKMKQILDSMTEEEKAQYYEAFGIKKMDSIENIESKGKSK